MDRSVSKVATGFEGVIDGAAPCRGATVGRGWIRRVGAGFLIAPTWCGRSVVAVESVEEVHLGASDQELILVSVREWFFFPHCDGLNGHGVG